MGYGEKANLNSRWNRDRSTQVKVPSTTQSIKVSTQVKPGEPVVIELSLKNVVYFFKDKFQRWLNRLSAPPSLSPAPTS